MSLRHRTQRLPLRVADPPSETERVLEAELAKLGVRVERQVDLHSFAQDDDGVSVVLDGPDGRTEHARVDWLMGCDGAHSAIRMGLGAQFEGSTLRSDWCWATCPSTGRCRVTS